MVHVKQFLLEWAKTYFIQRDAIRKELRSIVEDSKGFDLTIHFKTRDMHVLIMPELPKYDMYKELLSDDKAVCIAALNTSQNLKSLLDEWDKIVEHPMLSFVFVNPLAEHDTKWIIYPHTHDRISEKESLKTGLEAMFQNVSEVSQKDIERHLKGSSSL